MRAAMEFPGVDGMTQSLEKTGVARLPFVAFLLATAVVLAYYVPRSHVISNDNPTWYHRSVRWPFHAREELDYKRAIDVPAVNRWVYGIALHAAGLANEPGVAAEDSSFMPPKKGVDIPSHLTPTVALTMRSVNAVVLLVYYGCLAWVAVTCLGSWRAAAVPIAAVLMPEALRWVAAFRIGPDVFLLTGYLAFLAVWVRFHAVHRTASWASCIVLGMIGGAATAAKLNGALVVLAYTASVLWTTTGVRRFLMPLAICAVALATFMLLNPVFYLSGRAPWTVISDMLSRRAEVIANVNYEYPHSKWYTITAPFTIRVSDRVFDIGGHVFVMPHFRVPLWLCVPACILAQIVAARRYEWMKPVAWWGIVIFIGNAAAINIPVQWYTAPLLLSLLFPTALAITALAREHLEMRRQRKQALVRRADA